jgi:hypothetical protein
MMMMNSPRKRSILILSLLALFIGAMVIPRCSCTSTPDDPIDSTDTTPKVPRVLGPEFNADSAMAFTRVQVDFGPRVPGTAEHAKCAEWIFVKMNSYVDTVVMQEAPTTTMGKMVTMKNIFAQYKPERTERILLVAHWDTRYIADRDTDTTLRGKPIDGANDGASGVSVLLEIARTINEKDPNIGVDFLFVDAEDQGTSGGAETSWCLGSQYWAQNVKAEYSKTVRYGILLDMVGAKGAIFPREGTSVRYASNVVEKVWSAAKELGYGAYFVNGVTGETIDDNRFIIQHAGIPCIDIVHYDPSEQDYGPTHHRHTDNMDNIDPATLNAVGSVVIDVLYNEMPVRRQ